MDKFDLVRSGLLVDLTLQTQALKQIRQTQATQDIQNWPISRLKRVSGAFVVHKVFGNERFKSLKSIRSWCGDELRILEVVEALVGALAFALHCSRSTPRSNRVGERSPLLF